MKFLKVFLKLFLGIILVVTFIFGSMYLIVHFLGDTLGLVAIGIFVIAIISAVIAFFETKLT